MALLVHSAGSATFEGGAGLPPDASDVGASAALDAGDLVPMTVSVSINGRIFSDGEMVFREGAGVWLVPAPLLANASISGASDVQQIDGVDYCRLAPARGIGLRYDIAEAALFVTIAPDYFEGQRLSAQKESPPLEEGEITPALFLDYDIGVRAASGSAAADGAASLGASSGFGLALSQWAFSSADGGSFLRLGSSVTFDDPDRRASLVIGDGVEAHAPGMVPVAYGGVGWFSNFEMDPDFVALPLPRARGAAMLPGQVNVFVNGQPGFSGDIREGDYEITDIPASAGAGMLDIVATDIYGRETRLQEPIYVAADLLKPGLSAYGIAAGWMRRAGAHGGLQYDAPFGRAGLRHGVSDWITVNAAAEASGDLAGLALGADIRLGDFGAASAGLNASHAGDGAANGYAFTGRLSRSAGAFSFAAGGRYASRDFARLGEFSDVRVKSRYDANASLDVFDGTLALGGSSIDYWDATAQRLARVSYNHDLGPGQITIAGAYIDGTEGEAELRALFTMPLSGGHNAAAQVSRKGGNEWKSGVSLAKSPPAGAGAGYNVALETDGRRADARAGLRFRHRAAEGVVDAALRGGKFSAGARLSGGVALADGGVFFARDVIKGGLLVETPGIAAAPLSIDHQPYGDTGKRGRALVAVSPFTGHSISIDESVLPMDISLDRSSAKIATGRGRIAKVRFAPAATYAITAIAVFPDGNAPERGAPVTSPMTSDGADEPLPVGHGGRVYLTSDRPQRAYSIHSRRGRCEIDVDFLALKKQFGENGLPPEIICRPEGGRTFVDNRDGGASAEPAPLRQAPEPKAAPNAFADAGKSNGAARTSSRPALRPGPDISDDPGLDFAARHARIAVVLFPGGREVPRGARLRAEGKRIPAAIGYDGLVYLAANDRKARFAVVSDGETCAFDAYFDNLRNGETDHGVWPVYVCR